MSQHSTPNERHYKISERDVAILGETFFSDKPDGFYVETGSLNSVNKSSHLYDVPFSYP
jgi:hypothetical protein